MRVWGVLLTRVAEPSGAVGAGWLGRCCDGVAVQRIDETPAGVPDRLDGLVAGLRRMPAEVGLLVVVDDEALLTDQAGLVADMLARCQEGAAAVVVGAPVTDALKRVEAGEVVGTVERAGLFAPRLPHVLRRAALEEALAAGPVAPGTDPAVLLAQRGWPVAVVADPGRRATSEGASPSPGAAHSDRGRP